MNAESDLQVPELLGEASLQVWLDGGWGVDALLGEQTCTHADLGIIAGSNDVSKPRGWRWPRASRVALGA
jgi:lincosamide nucleotidyltransferase A/C/D/E